MDEKREPRFKNSNTDETSGFSELKKVIEEELGHADQWDDYSNAFSPLTDGLGLDSPKKKEMPAASPAPAASSVTPSRARLEPQAAPAEQVKRVRGKFEALSRNVEKKAAPIDAAAQSERLPPPINSPSLVRRVLAGVIDQIFVFTLWFIAMVITLKVLTGSFLGGVTTSVAVLEEARFLHFAILEFATIWVAYAVFCMGVLDMTFGMWVWGIRVGYMTQSKRTWILRKVLRTVFTFIFYAPVLPLIFLVFVGKRGRNVLDALSGTVVYQSVVID